MDRAFTFGIITDGSAEAVTRLQSVLDSIEAQGMADYEVLIVGNCPDVGRRNVRIIPFDEMQKPRWITRKKNMITENARHETIVYMHDYFLLAPNWHAGWRKFNQPFHACMNPIINADGTRYRDWSLFFDGSSMPAREFAGADRMENLLPYSETTLSRLMYFSGAYWVATKKVMTEIPLDERLCWGDGEDVIWSHRYRAKYSFTINPHSHVRIFGKKKDPIFRDVPADAVARMKAFVQSHPPAPGYGCSDDMNVWREHEHWGPVKKKQAVGGGA